MKKRADKKHFSFKGEYLKTFSFLRDSRDFIYAAILGFFIFAALGFFFSDLIQEIFLSFGVNINEKILYLIEKLISQTEGMSHGELIGFIFFNNLQSSFLSLALGIAAGIFPLFSLIFNGYLLGFVAFFSVNSAGYLILWRILPHGIFELPAIFISIGLGLKLGFCLLFKGSKDFKSNFFGSLKTFLLVVFPLLLIAAIIEGSLIFFGS
ncbi:MAG: stage II sporulation protein M [Nanoarchaeota archaeon]|mgnify:FL=1